MCVSCVWESVLWGGGAIGISPEMVLNVHMHSEIDYIQYIAPYIQYITAYSVALSQRTCPLFIRQISMNLKDLLLSCLVNEKKFIIQYTLTRLLGYSPGY